MSKASSLSSGSTRYYSLDSLRACMMLLGIWFHASANYTSLNVPAWRFRDPATSAFFNVPLLLIHVFRMPIFFVLAGLFARFSWQRAGTKAFLRNRATRILLPFVIGWPILYAVTLPGAAYATSLNTHTPFLVLSLDYYLRGKFLNNFATMHLWFLYYLVYLYLIFMAAAAAVHRWISADRQERIEAFFRRMVSSPWAPLVFALPTCVPLFFFHSATLETASSFIIEPKTVAAYTIFFGFGWLLYHQADLLPGFRRLAWVQIILALVLSPLYLLTIKRSLEVPLSEQLRPHLIAVAAGSLIIWLFIFGFLGLFVRYLDRPSARIRYLADASYWMYLVHLPLVLWLALAVRPLHVPAIVKFSIVMVIAVPILLASYEWCVRYTIIGRVLNGPRERKPAPEAMLDTKYSAAAAG